MSHTATSNPDRQDLIAICETLLANEDRATADNSASVDAAHAALDRWLGQYVAAATAQSTMFAIREVRNKEDIDRYQVTTEEFLMGYVPTIGDAVLLFDSKPDAEKYLADKGLYTEQQERAKLEAQYEKQYAAAIQRYERDLKEVEKMKAAGIPQHLHPKLSKPFKCGLPSWIDHYYEIVPAGFHDATQDDAQGARA